MKKQKILAVASGGGHWTQLLELSEAFTEHEISYLTTDINRAAPAHTELKIHIVPDADFSQKLKLCLLALATLIKVIKIRPHIVISTGAAPGFFAILIGRAIGAKTIWIDSLANYERPSLSGAKIRRFCHVFLTQWPHLEKKGLGSYWGRLI